VRDAPETRVLRSLGWLEMKPGWPLPLVLGGLLVMLAVLARPGSAEAHSLLVRSDPPQGARLRQPPTEVVAWFSEPLQPGVSTLWVLDGAGNRVDLGDARVGPEDPTR
jgi:methionine-rich copper-binding protein CopC